jgi:uncharacterized Zn finger protein
MHPPIQAKAWLTVFSPVVILLTCPPPANSANSYLVSVTRVERQGNNQAYTQAAGLLHRVKQLMGQLDEDGEFRQYLAQVRVEYKRKRNFMKLLEKIG